MWPFSEEKESEGIAGKNNEYDAINLFPDRFSEGKKQRVFHIKSLNTSSSIDIEIIFGKKNGVFLRNN